ncbi:peptidase S59 domain-containing protein [Haematococcus lacustris]|uniref:Peptidase S59 domain-containing protein n=1 Tax=Haematococcus lacustris TaxID=44745 RepID=A0A699Z5G9_HAELA|nr:peptidase S59 domain-containing protein [Haematococcus lacustris]
MLKTGSVPYRVTEVAEGPSPATGTFLTITAMPAYLSKSMEELRWENYQQMVKEVTPGMEACCARARRLGVYGSSGVHDA